MTPTRRRRRRPPRSHPPRAPPPQRPRSPDAQLRRPASPDALRDDLERNGVVTREAEPTAVPLAVDDLELPLANGPQPDRGVRIPLAPKRIALAVIQPEAPVLRREVE